MKKVLIVVAILVVVLAVGASAYHEFGRPDCPGKIVCPLTGQVICADKCPLGSPPEAEVPACCKSAKP